MNKATRNEYFHVTTVSAHTLTPGALGVESVNFLHELEFNTTYFRRSMPAEVLSRSDRIGVFQQIYDQIINHRLW